MCSRKFQSVVGMLGSLSVAFFKDRKISIGSVKVV